MTEPSHDHGAHDHGAHDHEAQTGSTFERPDQSFWDERYRSKPALWSGKPNVHLVTEAKSLTAGTALDVGAGEGADAIWLAGRGWDVTALDISAVALERAAAHAEQAGPRIAERISWLHQDVVDWEPPADGYDLVSSQFVHLPRDSRQGFFQRLIAAVAPGGTLLVVGHHPSDMQTTMPRPKTPELFFTGDDVVGRLDAVEWESVTNVAAARTANDREGCLVTIHDTVVRATRKG